MKDFHYKEYTEEESRIYNKAMDEIIAALEDGMAFHAACDSVSVDDTELKRFIVDDVLKVIIAHHHYKNGLSLEDVAATLKVSIEIIHKANDEMLEDISRTATEVFKTTNPDMPFGNA
jgi:ribosome-binding protein aMBF1 (putative translation factor)